MTGIRIKDVFRIAGTDEEEPGLHDRSFLRLRRIRRDRATRSRSFRYSACRVASWSATCCDLRRLSSWETWTFGSGCDGAFAPYAKAPSREVWKVGGVWTDIELATLPYTYFTAENMLHRAGVTAGDLVLVSSS